jgi:hypothetical protein
VIEIHDYTCLPMSDALDYRRDGGMRALRQQKTAEDIVVVVGMIRDESFGGLEGYGPEIDGRSFV